MTGIVAVTLILPYEDIRLIEQRVRARLDALPADTPRGTDILLDEIGLDRHVQLVPVGTEATLRRQGAEDVPHLMKGWASDARIVDGGPEDVLFGRHRLLYDAYLRGMFDDDDETDDDEM